MIFVFGSNLKGVHGAGAAKYAVTHEGAKWGIGVGRQGNSYAIPTKNRWIQTMSLPTIFPYVLQFLTYAKDNPHDMFKVTCIGCGLAGFKHEQIAPMFQAATDNCYFDEKWKPYLNDKRYWGKG